MHDNQLSVLSEAIGNLTALSYCLVGR